MLLVVGAASSGGFLVVTVQCPHVVSDIRQDSGGKWLFMLNDVDEP